MEHKGKDISHSGSSANNCIHSVSDSRGVGLAGSSQGSTGMAGMAGRRTDAFIKWCNPCKHEVPEYLEIDKCEICGGEVAKVN